MAGCAHIARIIRNQVELCGGTLVAVAGSAVHTRAVVVAQTVRGVVTHAAHVAARLCRHRLILAGGTVDAGTNVARPSHGAKFTGRTLAVT